MLAIDCRSKRWVINLRRDDLVNRSPEYLYKNCTVCSEHFEPIMFMHDIRNRLYSHSIPTIVNVSNPPKTVMIYQDLTFTDKCLLLNRPKKYRKKNTKNVQRRLLKLRLSGSQPIFHVIRVAHLSFNKLYCRYYPYSIKWVRYHQHYLHQFLVKLIFGENSTAPGLFQVFGRRGWLLLISVCFCCENVIV